MQTKAEKGGKERLAVDAEGSCHRSITCSPLQSSLHQRVREEEPTGSVRSNRSRRASSGGKKEGSRKQWRWGRRSTNPGVLGRNTGSQSRGALSLWFSSITLPLFFIPVTSFMAPWLLDPGVCCQFSALPCHFAPPPSLEAAVAPAELEPPTVVVRQCRPCDGLSVTVGLLTFGRELTGKRSVHTWVLHARANASSSSHQTPSNASSAWT